MSEPAAAPTPEGGHRAVPPPAAEARRWVRMERRFSASPERVLRCLTDPEEIVRWFPERIEGSLAAGTRSTLIWPHERVWWDVLTIEPGRSLVFRWPWGPEEALVTTATIRLERDGYGSRLFLEDGPFPLDQPGGLEAWAEAIEGWADALARLRAFVDFSIDLRMRG
jgi:uncharacterized protein YndB with AHSA1/START domain